MLQVIKSWSKREEGRKVAKWEETCWETGDSIPDCWIQPQPCLREIAPYTFYLLRTASPSQRAIDNIRNSMSSQGHELTRWARTVGSRVIVKCEITESIVYPDMLKYLARDIPTSSIPVQMEVYPEIDINDWWLFRETFLRKSSEEKQLMGDERYEDKSRVDGT